MAKAGPSISDEFSNLLRAVRAQTEDWKAAGLAGVPGRVAERVETAPTEVPQEGGSLEKIAGTLRGELEEKANPEAAMQDTIDFGSPDLESAGSPEEAIEKLRAEAIVCTRCEELASTRTQVVFGQGNHRAELVFVGEAPGQNEDRQGLAFVGRAGQLLTEIITKAMGMRREDVYICNILKCRPPNNRNPLPNETINCLPYLQRQLEIIRPKIICTLGSVATQILLERHDPIGRMRGLFFPYRGTRLMPTYHPAYLLRNYTYETRKKVHDDVMKIVAELGRSPSEKP